MPPKAKSGFDRVKKIGTKLEGVTVTKTWGTPALKVGGKVLCFIPTNKQAEPGSLGVRLDFYERDLRIQLKPKTYYLKPHYESYPYVLARLSKLSDGELAELLETSWTLCRAKR